MEPSKTHYTLENGRVVSREYAVANDYHWVSDYDAATGHDSREDGES